jgi:hypothetical protein
MKKLLIILCILISAISCKEKSEFDRFKQLFSKRISLKGKILTHTDDLLGNPTDLRVSDSLLIFLDPMSNTHLVAVNKNHPESVSRFLPKGRGPNEYGLVRGFELDRYKNICFFDDISNNYIETPIALNKENVSPVFKAYIKLDFGKVLNSGRLNDKLFSTGVFDRKGRFLVSKVSTSMKTDEHTERYLIGKYPQDVYSNLSNLKRGMAYQTRLRKNDETQSIVTYSLMVGELNFLRLSNDSIRLIKNFVFSLPKYTPDPNGIAVTFSAESPATFLDLCFYQDYVFALYSGKSYKESGNDAYMGNNIFIFSKDGKPKTQIILDQNISCFDVDVANAKIYGLTFTPIPRIVAFVFNKDEI